MSVLVLYLSILGRQSLEREQKVVFYTENNGHDQLLKIKHNEIWKNRAFQNRIYLSTFGAMCLIQSSFPFNLAELVCGSNGWLILPLTTEWFGLIFLGATSLSPWLWLIARLTRIKILRILRFKDSFFQSYNPTIL